VNRVSKGIFVALLVAAAFVYWLGANLERFINRVEPTPLPAVSERARLLHDSSLVVDLHADSLLFGRNLLERSDVGHVDLPRLLDGGVALQAFFLVTRAPYMPDMSRVSGDGFDLLTLGGAVQRSPVFTLGPRDRALWQAARLADMVDRSADAMRLIRTRADLDGVIEDRKANRDRVGVLLGVEGAHALEDDGNNIELLFDAGVRILGLAHFFDNRYAGSAHGLEKGGLSEAGRALISRREQLGIAVDLAHVSPRAVDDALAMATRPVLVSHTGVQATCSGVRNLSDDQIHAIAAGGGVIGIGFFDLAVCGISPSDTVAAMKHVVALVGDDYVALGSDFDGGTTVAFDAGELRALTQQMLDDGLPEASVRKILGANTIRVLRRTLPSGD
jgi:microsomal dipeptidase-like Zn-dependent dipeptidase